MNFMKRAWTNARVSLRGAIIECDDGASALVPWRELSGRVAPLRVSARAREGDSRLPQVLSFESSVGSATILGLRIRALSQAIRHGTVDGYFLVAPPFRLIAFGFALAIGAAATWAIFEIGLRAVSVWDVPGVVVQFDDRLERTISGFRAVLAACTTLIPAAFVVWGTISRRWPRVLAVHAIADGVILRVDDGRSEFRSWSSVAAAAQRNRTAVGRVVSYFCSELPTGARGASFDLRLIQRAAERVFGRRERAQSLQQRLWAIFQKSMMLGFAGAAFWVIVTTLAIAFPDQPRPGRNPPRKEFVAAIGFLFAMLYACSPVLLLFGTIGWHRARLRWRQMWQGTRSESGRSNSNGWPK